MTPNKFTAAQSALARSMCSPILMEEVPDGEYFWFDDKWWLKLPANFACFVYTYEHNQHRHKCSFKSDVVVLA